MSADLIEISSLFARFADLLDEARYDDIHAIYTDDVVVHSPRGGELRGIDEVIAFLRNSHVDGQRTQHLPVGVLADVDGDRAKATANSLTCIYRDGEPPHRTGSVRLTWEPCGPLGAGGSARRGSRWCGSRRVPGRPRRSRRTRGEGSANPQRPGRTMPGCRCRSARPPASTAG